MSQSVSIKNTSYSYAPINLHHTFITAKFDTPYFEEKNFFSTAALIVRWEDDYNLRVQIEFNFFTAKSQLGLTDTQWGVCAMDKTQHQLLLPLSYNTPITFAPFSPAKTRNSETYSEGCTVIDFQSVAAHGKHKTYQSELSKQVIEYAKKFSW